MYIIIKKILIFLTISIIFLVGISCKSDEPRVIYEETQKAHKDDKIQETTKELKEKADEAEPEDKGEVVTATAENPPSAEATPNSPVEVPDKVQDYLADDLELLARVIWSEAGSDWLSDEHQRAIASVVINRVNDGRFPNTIRDVIYQKGQYGCVYNGMINQTPNQRAYDNARYVLENGITIPSNVVWQSQSPQGNGLYKYIEGHYFCY